jgi:hypothetical protein
MMVSLQPFLLPLDQAVIVWVLGCGVRDGERGNMRLFTFFEVAFLSTFVVCTS